METPTDRCLISLLALGVCLLAAQPCHVPAVFNIVCTFALTGVLRSAAEIEGIRKACLVGREALDAAHAAIRPGITTDEIDRIVSSQIQNMGKILLFY
jgi:Xaa-Pro aminopeptidase